MIMGILLKSDGGDEKLSRMFPESQRFTGIKEVPGRSFCGRIIKI